MSSGQEARCGAKAFEPGTARLPGVFPREMGPNTLAYLKEVVDSGLASDMEGRFTSSLAALYGVRHAVGTPGCTQAIFAAMLGVDFPPGSWTEKHRPEHIDYVSDLIARVAEGHRR